MTRFFKLLGTLEVKENGRLSSLMTSTKGCALLTYLIVTNQSQPRIHVADLLWEATSTADALRNLRQLLHLIRPHIPELVITRQNLSLQFEAATYIDYQIVRAALDQDDITQLDQGLQQYSGDLLATFYLDEASYFNEWLLLTREKLRAEVMDAYHRLCTAYGRQQTWETGIAVARRWLMLDDLHEPTYRWLMQFLAANGQVAAARQQYESCKIRLWEELGVEPEAATQQLAEQLEGLAGGEGVVLTAVSDWQPDPLPPPDTLPEPQMLPPHAILPYQRYQGFVGRGNDLVQLGHWLLPWEADMKTGDWRLDEFSNLQPPTSTVAITGIGGLGKTQLAVEFAYRYGRFYAGGVYWLSFAQDDGVAKEVAAIGGERGMKLFTNHDKLTLKDQVERVQRAWQESTPRLLIFDNCEDEHLLTEWLPVSGGCRILLTSRRGLWSSDLNVTILPLSTLARQESVVVLQRLVNKISPVHAGDIASEVGDLPLALHLAGSFLQRYAHISPARYLVQLRSQGLLQHPSLQGRGSDHSPTEHERHVGRTFALNFAQLNPADEVDDIAQRLLACVISFAHGEPIPQSILLATVLTDPDDLLAELLAMDGLARLATLGMLTLTGYETAQVHRLVAAYAAVELGEKVDEGRTAVETHLLHLLEDQFAQTRFMGHLPLVATHLQTITDAALARADQYATQFALWWGRYLRDMGEAQRSREVLETAVAMRRTLFPDGDLILADLLALLGTLCWEMEEDQAAWPYYEEVVAIRQRLLGKNHTLTAQSLHNLAILHARSGSNITAKTLYEATLTIYEQLDPPDEQHIALTLFNLGLLLRQLNFLKESEQRHQQALTLRERLYEADNPSIAKSLNSLGYLAALCGDYQMALRHYERALRIRQKVLGQSHNTTAVSLLNMGLTKSQVGDFEEAEAYLQEAFAIRQAHFATDHPSIGQCLYFLGRHYFQAGQVEQAHTLLAESLLILQKTRPDHPETADAYVYLGNCYLQKGELAQARTHLLQAERIQREQVAPQHLATAYRLLSSGDLAYAEGKRDEARQLYEQAETILVEAAVSSHPDLATVRKRLADLMTK